MNSAINQLDIRQILDTLNALDDVEPILDLQQNNKTSPISQELLNS